MSIHRSFKLTRSDGTAAPSGIGFELALVQQLVALVLAGLMLDGGALMQMFGLAAVAYWICVAIIWIRRRHALTSLDKIVIRVGFLVACVISVVLTSVIWQL